MGSFHVTDALPKSTSKGAGHMAKESVLEEALWNTAAVQRYKGPLPTLREFEERPSDELLANTGFSYDGHRNVEWGQFAHDSGDGSKASADEEHASQAFAMHDNSASDKQQSRLLGVWTISPLGCAEC